MTRSPSHELIDLDDRDRWSDAVRCLPHTSAHRWDHVAAFQASTGHRTLLYVCRAHDQLVVVCPLAVRGGPSATDVYTPYGFGGFTSSGPLPWFAAAYQAFAADQGWITSYIALNPFMAHPLGFSHPALTSGPDLYVLDLRPELEEVLAGMSAKRRTMLRQWDRSPAALTWDRGEITDFACAVAPSFFERRSASSAYRFAPESWCRLLASESVLALGVRAGDRLVAASIFAWAGPLADHLFGLSEPGSERYSAPLIWEAARELKRRGAEQLNLGGGIRPDDGVAKFKSRFGAQRVSSQTLRLIHDRNRYALLCREAGVDEGSTYFPPYREVRR